MNEIELLIAENPNTKEKLRQLGYADKENVERKLKEIEKGDF